MVSAKTPMSLIIQKTSSYIVFVPKFKSTYLVVSNRNLPENLHEYSKDGKSVWFKLNPNNVSTKGLPLSEAKVIGKDGLLLSSFIYELYEYDFNDKKGVCPRVKGIKFSKNEDKASKQVERQEELHTMEELLA